MKINRIRELHKSIAPIVLLPLTVTVLTGVIYRLGKSWFDLSRDQVHFLMVIHEGEYLGQTLEPIYVLLNALGLIWMLVTGATMLINSWKKSSWWRQLTNLGKKKLCGIVKINFYLNVASNGRMSRLNSIIIPIILPYKSSGITHFGGAVNFFNRAISAISSILSKDVSSINLEVSSTNSLLGQSSGRIQPLTHSTLQLTFCSVMSGFFELYKQIFPLNYINAC